MIHVRNKWKEDVSKKRRTKNDTAKKRTNEDYMK